MSGSHKPMVEVREATLEEYERMPDLLKRCYDFWRNLPGGSQVLGWGFYRKPDGTLATTMPTIYLLHDGRIVGSGARPDNAPLTAPRIKARLTPKRNKE